MNTSIVLMMMFTAASHAYKLPAGLISAVCFVESTHTITAVHFDDGKDDSVGICQVQPKTAKFLKFNGNKNDLFNPKVNIKYAAMYLSYQLKRYNGDVYKAVAAYNAGSYKTSSNDGIAANHTYVRKVLNAWIQGR